MVESTWHGRTDTMARAEIQTPRRGEVIRKMDVRTIDDHGLNILLEQLMEHRFILLPGQDLSNDDYVRFGKRWGRPVMLIARKNTLDSHPEMIMQSNREATPEFIRNVANHWHCDSSYEAETATFTMLYGVEAPEEGGETLFADLVAAYEELPADKQAFYDTLLVKHATSAATPLPDEFISDSSTLPDDFRKAVNFPDPVTHPLVRTHPINGRKALYGLGGSAYGIEGWPDEEGNRLVMELRQYATQDRFRSACKLMPGDILIWDNFSTMHRATPIAYSDAPGERRLNYRISLKGVPDFIRGNGHDHRGRPPA